jgi:hypothetical protein
MFDATNQILKAAYAALEAPKNDTENPELAAQVDRLSRANKEWLLSEFGYEVDERVEDLYCPVNGHDERRTGEWSAFKFNYQISDEPMSRVDATEFAIEHMLKNEDASEVVATLNDLEAK